MSSMHVRYELDELVSTDTAGTTYRAADRATNAAVEIWLPRIDDLLVVAALKKRCRLAMLVQSPFVRRIAAAEWESDSPFVAFEPAPPCTLESLAEMHRPFNFAQSARLIHRVNAALPEAHRLGLAHGRLTANQIGWVGSLSDPDARCSLDFVRPPRSQRVAPEDDVRQLYDLWLWLLDNPHDVDAVVPLELRPLWRPMRSVDPEERPTSAAIGETLAGWFTRTPVVPLSGTMIPPASNVDEPNTPDLGSTLVLPASSSASPLESSAPRPTSSDPLSSRTTLGRFQLRNKLGEGGMGAVWRAEDPIDGGSVAIKVLRADLARNDMLLKRFHREARLLAEVDNPYVARLLEINADGELHYLVLEFVDGRNLQEYLLERGRLPEREAAAIVADVARALQDAHARGIVHRDLKPDNILLCRPAMSPMPSSTSLAGSNAPPPRVKLTDFGLARHVDESESLHLTSAGSILGTPLYFAPEQCAGKVDVDVRADIYSLGATLFHLLVGRPPFESANVIGLITKHLQETAARVRTLVPELTEAIEEIVAKCLQKAPAARYQNASELLGDLERLVRGEPTSIVAHPLLPVGDTKDVLAFDFVWELKNSPEALWPQVSNTERLNRAIGLSAVDYTTTANPHGGSQRFAQFRKLGLTLAWKEHPFEWIEGRRMGVLREFTQGPWKWFTSVVELTPRGDGGTTLSHRIRILPMSFIGKTAAKIEIGLRSRAALEKVYRHIDAALSGDLGRSADPFEDARELPQTQRRTLEQRLQAIVERGVEPLIAERLGDFLAEGADQELARIRPLALAKQLAVDERQMLNACLMGAREGLLTMLWDILCPVCRIPSQVQNSLKAIKDHGQCESCQTEFELDFANSIELIFRIAPDIRPTETGMYCISGPGHSPHVAAQVRLAAGERFVLNLALREGAYRLRGPQLPYLIDFRVLSHASSSGWELSLGQSPPADLPRQLQPNAQRLVLVNDTTFEIIVRVERIANRTDACTAARAAATPLFRELFAGECLAPDQLVQIEQITLLMTRLDRAGRLYFELGDAKAFARLHEHFRALDAIVRREGGSLIKTVGEGTCAVFTEPVMAMRAALAMQLLAEPELRIAVHRGPAMVATLNDHLDYFGSTVSMTAQLLDTTSSRGESVQPRLFLSDAMARDPQVGVVLSQTANGSRLCAINSAHDAQLALELMPSN